LPSPLIRSPSQCPGNCLSSISGGRTWMLSTRVRPSSTVNSGFRHFRSQPLYTNQALT
jgi:hypothetical protein